MKTTCQHASTTECSAFLRSARNGSVESYRLGAELRLETYQTARLFQNRFKGQCGLMRFVSEPVYVHVSNVGNVDRLDMLSMHSYLCLAILVKAS